MLARLERSPSNIIVFLMIFSSRVIAKPHKAAEPAGGIKFYHATKNVVFLITEA